jgi:hypothetical protein
VFRPRVQFRGQRLDARLEPLGAPVRLGHLTCRCGKLLVRHGQRDMICNPPRCGQVLAGECVRTLRPEAESNSLIPGTSHHDQARTKASGKEAFAKVVRLDDEKIGRREVVDQHKALFRLAVVHSPDPREPGERVGRRRLDQDLTMIIVERHRQQIVRHDLRRNLGHLRKDGTDVEDCCNRAAQLDGAFQVGRVFGGRHCCTPLPGRKMPRGVRVGHVVHLIMMPPSAPELRSRLLPRVRPRAARASST